MPAILGANGHCHSDYRSVYNIRFNYSPIHIFYVQSTCIRCAHANNWDSSWTLKRFRSHKKQTEIHWVTFARVATNIKNACASDSDERNVANVCVMREHCGTLPFSLLDWMQAEEGSGGLRKLLFYCIATNSIFISPTQFTWREASMSIGVLPAPHSRSRSRLYVNGLQCESAVKIRITIMAITNFVSLTLFFFVISFGLMSLAVGTLQIWKTGESAQRAYANQSRFFSLRFLEIEFWFFTHRRKWVLLFATNF